MEVSHLADMILNFCQCLIFPHFVSKVDCDLFKIQWYDLNPMEFFINTNKSSYITLIHGKDTTTKQKRITA